VLEYDNLKIVSRKLDGSLPGVDTVSEALAHNACNYTFENLLFSSPVAAAD
jgi:hypothetical protein